MRSGDPGTFDSWTLKVSYGDGTMIESCTQLPSGCLEWVASTDCGATSEFCNAATGVAVCVACQDTCPGAGESRCNGTAVESCSLGAQGCLEWQADIDCDVAVPGDRCDDTGATTVCYTPVGEDCASPVALGFGANVVDWRALNRDYLTAIPSCGSTYALNGPDLVLTYTPSYTGGLRLTMDKPTSTRYDMVVSDGGCGTLAPQLALRLGVHGRHLDRERAGAERRDLLLLPGRYDVGGEPLARSVEHHAGLHRHLPDERADPLQRRCHRDVPAERWRVPVVGGHHGLLGDRPGLQ